jgi:hypothetical protein
MNYFLNPFALIDNMPLSIVLWVLFGAVAFWMYVVERKK